MKANAFHALPALFVLLLFFGLTSTATAHTVPACELGDETVQEQNPHCQEGHEDDDNGGGDDNGDDDGDGGDNGGGDDDGDGGDNGDDDGDGGDNGDDDGDGGDNGDDNGGGSGSTGHSGNGSGGSSSGSAGTNPNSLRLDRHEKRLDRHDREIAALQKGVRDNRRGIALAIASGSHQFNVGENAPFQLSLAGGYYAGEEAVSFAAGGAVSDRVFLNANYAVTNGGEEAFGVSATWAFD